MQIVDAQVHIWSQGESTGHHRRTPIDAPTLSAEMAQAGVDRAVLVPPLWDPSGNGYSLSLAAREPNRFAVMGLLDTGPEAAASRVRHWRDQPGMLGIRFLFNTKERAAPLLDGRFDDVWPVAEETGLPVAMLVPGALAKAGEIAERHPRLTLIVDHLGVPRGATGPGAFEHLPELLALARYANVYVKAVGVGDYALDPYPFHSLNETLRRVVDTFGPDRVMWGSDLSRLHHPYWQCLAHFRENLPWLSAADRESVMGGNILRLLDWQRR
ncbi:MULTISPECIES: amidohydrolase family protein [unclassified Caballeronia]|uniref:amidohydrolase family protein n=1 Tax=unclassified Caballeronia TaxID=2646786 RepID=UPI00285A8327|nr:MULTISPECIES: amidohydrolase family protein [unclassified Caballeronia]MDR5752478.1 amidohydrolase family protein [Caballeronia sp. LZ024]MDR5845284.1 amidohydrolase family protein [Caballeronia sp. LZ031]